MLNRNRSLLGLSLLCASAVLSAEAQGVWTVQRPLPTNTRLSAIHAIDKDRVIACGEMGQIFRTEDGGATWKEAISGTRRFLRGLAGSRGNSALFAVGDSGTIIASADGGSTWRPQASGTQAKLNAVSVLDAKTAYVGGAGGALLKTLDGGATWMRLPSATGLSFRAISAADAQTVYAASTRDTLFKTSDGGATWKAIFIAPIQGMDRNGSGLYGVSAVDADTVFVSALDVIDPYPRRWVCRTTDGGSHWTRFDSTGGITYAISAVSGRTAFIAGFNDLSSTQDGGATWITKPQPAVTREYVQSNDAVSAVDAQTAFATGSFGMIFSTTDGGRNWRELPESYAAMDLFAIRAVSPSLAFASGARGAFLKTADGANWKAMPLAFTREIYGFDTRDGALILAAGYSDTILRSTDGGASWSKQEIPGLGPRDALIVVSFGDAQTVFAAGWNGFLMKSADAGATWNKLASGTTRNINAIQAVGPSLVFAACDSGLFLKSADGGATWDSLPTGTRKNLLSLHFLNASVGYLSGHGTLKRTADGGGTWDSLLPSFRSDLFYSVRAANEKTAYFTGYAGSIDKTVDGGATWAREDSRAGRTLRAISIVDETTAYAAGELGTIVKFSGRTASLAPGVRKRAIPALRVMGGRVYADLPAAGSLSGRVLSLQGRTLSFLEFGPLDAGPHVLPLPELMGGPYLLDVRYGGDRWPLLLPR